MKGSVLLLAIVSLLVTNCTPGICAPASQDAGSFRSQNRQDITIPFAYDPPAVPDIVIQVSINGHKPLPFLVDTGVFAPVAIESHSIRELGLKPDPSVNRQEPWVGGWTTLKNIFLEGQTPGDGLSLNVAGPIPVIDLGGIASAFVGVRIAGIIGLPSLSSTPCRFDFQAKTITFLLSHRYDPPSGAVSLPLHADPNNAGLLDVPVSLSGNTPVNLELDTGNNGTKAPLDCAAGLKPEAASSSGNMSLYGIYVTPEYLLPKIRLGGMVVNDAVVDFLPPSAVQTALGPNILSLFLFTLDVPDHKLVLEKPYSPHPTPNRAGWSGIEGESRGKKWIVGSVAAGSPAGKAGIKRGDEIICVDGHNTAGLPSFAINELLYGLMGAKARIRVLRNGIPLSFSFVRLDYFAQPGTPIDGLAITMVRGQPFTILSVAPESAGAKAGLKAQDKLLSIDGISTATMTTEQMIGTMQKDRIALSIQRAGYPTRIAVRLADK